MKELKELLPNQTSLETCDSPRETTVGTSTKHEDKHTFTEKPPAMLGESSNEAKQTTSLSSGYGFNGESKSIEVKPKAESLQFSPASQMPTQLFADYSPKLMDSQNSSSLPKEKATGDLLNKSISPPVQIRSPVCTESSNSGSNSTATTANSSQDQTSEKPKAGQAKKKSRLAANFSKKV